MEDFVNSLPHFGIRKPKPVAEPERSSHEQNEAGSHKLNTERERDPKD